MLASCEDLKRFGSETRNDHSTNDLQGMLESISLADPPLQPSALSGSVDYPHDFVPTTPEELASTDMPSDDDVTNDVRSRMSTGPSDEPHPQPSSYSVTRAQLTTQVARILAESRSLAGMLRQVSTEWWGSSAQQARRRALFARAAGIRNGITQIMTGGSTPSPTAATVVPGAEQIQEPGQVSRSVEDRRMDSITNPSEATLAALRAVQGPLGRLVKFVSNGANSTSEAASSGMNNSQQQQQQHQQQRRQPAEGAMAESLVYTLLDADAIDDGEEGDDGLFLHVHRDGQTERALFLRDREDWQLI